MLVSILENKNSRSCLSVQTDKFTQRKAVERTLEDHGVKFRYDTGGMAVTTNCSHEDSWLS